MTESDASTSLARVVVGARAGCAAAVLLLALTVAGRHGLSAALLVLAVAVVVSAVQTNMKVSIGWIAAGEAALTGIVIGGDLPAAAVGLPYLLIPPLAAGCLGTARMVVWVVAIESSTVIAPVVFAGNIPETVGFLRLLAPWIVVSLGVGALGARLRVIGPIRRGDDASYESARRLIGQLRGVAGRLPRGLDLVGMANEVLADVHARESVTCSALLVPGPGGQLTSLAGSTADCNMGTQATAALVDDCIRAQQPLQRIIQQNSGEPCHVLAVPLVIEERLIAVAVIGFAHAVSTDAVVALTRTLDRHALRLDTALAFEQVRCLATSEERRRVAGEIHDGIAQDAAGLAYLVDQLIADNPSIDQRTTLVQLRDELRRLVAELRLTIYDLRSDAAAADGLGSALSQYIQRVTRHSSMALHFVMDETQHRLSAEQETGLLRIAQEAITNARKHSGGANIWVHCTVDPPHASLVVEDDGRWLVAQENGDSFGIRLMRERAERLHAEVSIEPRAGGGTRVEVRAGKVAETSASRKESHAYESAASR